MEIPEALRDRLGAEGSRALAELLNEATREMRSNVILMAEQRFARRLSDELAKVRVEFHEGLRDHRAAVDERIGELESRLQNRIGELDSRVARHETMMIDRMAGLETRLVRWAFGFWLGQFAALVGVLFAFFRP